MGLLRANGGASSPVGAVVLLTVAALGAVALLAGSSIVLASQAVGRAVDDRVRSTAAVSAVFAEQTTDGLAALVQSYGTRRLLADGVVAGASGADEVGGQLSRLVESDLGVSGAFITDVDGTLTHVHPQAPHLVGRNFAYRDWFTGLEEAGGPYVSEAYRSALPGSPLVVAVVDHLRAPGGAPIGIIAIIFDLDAILAFSTEIGAAQGIDLMVTDSQGIVLSNGQDQELVSLRDDPRVKEALRGRSGVVGYTASSALVDRGVEVHSAYAPVRSTGWTIVASIPDRVAFAGVTRLRSTVLTIAAVLVLVILVGAILTAGAQRRRHEVEVQVRRQDKELARVVDSTDEAFVSIDGSGLVTAWSRSAEALFGWSADEVMGSSLADTLIPPGQRAAHRHGVATYVPGADSTVVGQRIELTALHRDGHELPVELGVWAHEDGDGYSGFIHDISERVTFQRELEAARDAAMQASRHKSEFLATMSHEIRTPLNAVIGMTGLLLDTRLDEQQRDFTETVRVSGEALLSVINDILDFSKIEASDVELEVQPFCLRECVEDALTLVALTAGSKGLELVAELGESCPDLVVGDVTRFRQVLVNLVSNAVKFTERGEVVVTVAAEPWVTGDREVRLSVAVRDTGIGIPADRMDRLFQPFSQVDSSTTRTHGGTGLGLVISRRLAEAMGGALRVTSEAGAGSTFVFDAVLGVCTDRRSAALTGVGELAGRTVLVVDDNDTNRRVLQQAVRGWGMSCIDAATPAAALALLPDRPDIDVAVLDMHMPGMDGVQLATAMRHLPAGRDLPLILLTSVQSRPAPPDRDLFTALITKPARSTTLCQRLIEAVAPVQATMNAVETAGGRRGTDGAPVVTPPLRVLLAEDNAVNQKVAQLILTKLGYRVDSVSNGQEALQAVRSGRYDVVLMDVQMPVLDGIDATRAIRAEVALDRQPHIIAMTASVLIEDEEACRDAGMDSYLTKPIRPRELDEALARVTRARPERPS